MNSHQIKAFLCVAKHLNYTAASLELNIPVSTLSRQISSLETELNMQLFLRDNKRVLLTRNGAFLAQELSIIQEQMDNIISNSKRIYEGFSGELVCGVYEDITLNGVLQEGFHRYLQERFNVSLVLKRGSYKALIDGVLDGSLDCIITFLFSIESIVSLHYKIAETITEGFLVSAKGPLARENSFSVEKFKNQTFILISENENETIGKGPFTFFRKFGFMPRFIIVPNMDTATLMVEAGLGVSFSYSKSVGSYNPALKFIPMSEKKSITKAPKIVLAWNEINTNPLLASFIDSF